MLSDPPAVHVPECIDRVCVHENYNRYTYLADPNAGDGGDKEASELWAFSAAILPLIASCDTDVGAVVRANTDITSSDAPMIANGYLDLKAQIEGQYTCMGITCDQVGGLYDSENGEFFSGFDTCDGSTISAVSSGSSDDGSISEGGVAGIVVAVGAVAVIAAVGLFMWKKKKGKSASTVDANLGNF